MPRRSTFEIVVDENRLTAIGKRTTLTLGPKGVAIITANKDGTIKSQVLRVRGVGIFMMIFRELIKWEDKDE